AWTTAVTFVALMLVGASADASVSVHVERQQALSYRSDQASPAIFRMMRLGVTASTGTSGDIQSLSSTPSSFTASILHYEFATNETTSLSFDMSSGSGTFSADPAGNAITFSGCLVPLEGGACRHFDLVFSEPDQTGHMCLAPCAQYNAWLRPDGGRAAARGSIITGLLRNRYRVAGTFAGFPMLTSMPYESGDSAFSSVLMASATASLP
ncbi:MAG TPA: hypothetical protein VM600_05370, partial [Actinomycetota bacterium]|nr:hypothetical protein [Actinomycetota bacterium]